jgi:hypothetical protein
MAMISEAITNGVRALLFFGVWTCYLNTSTRVQNTFPVS